MYLEAQRDITAMESRNDNFLEARRREILRSKRFPLRYTSKWKSPLTRNTWTVTLVIKDKKALHEPEEFCYCRFNTHWGVDVVFPNYDPVDGRLEVVHITTHVFKRFRTRYLARHKADLQGVDVVDEFIQANALIHFPGRKSNGRFTCCVTGGIIFGEYDGEITRFTTFVSYEMLKEMQEKALRRGIESQKQYNAFMEDPGMQPYKQFEIQGRVASPSGFPSLSQQDIDEFVRQNPGTKRLAEIFYKDDDE